MKSIIGTILKTVLHAVDTKKEELKLVLAPEDLTEDDFNRYSVPVEDTKETLGYTDEDTMVKVPKVNLWSKWKYLYKPSLIGLEEVSSDDRIYFTLASGWDKGESIEYWYMTFPLNGTDKDVTEFYTSTRLDDII